MSWLRNLQDVSLFGLDEMPRRARRQALGAEMAPYDLAAPGAIREIKAALFALGQIGSDPFQNDPANVIVETRWKEFDPTTDVWEPAAGEEMLLAISRARGRGWQVPEPYVQQGLPGSVPQPTVNGLELLAGAVNERAPQAKMKLYEAWRNTGCTVCLDPPSLVSRPSSDTPVTPTMATGPRLVAPPDAPADKLALVQTAEAGQRAVWMAALGAEDEAVRLAMASAMLGWRMARDEAVQDAVAAMTPRTGTTTVDESFRTCVKSGGVWDGTTCTPKKPEDGSGVGWFVFVGACAAAAWGVTRYRRAR